jgi:hypothetical protein
LQTFKRLSKFRHFCNLKYLSQLPSNHDCLIDVFCKYILCVLQKTAGIIYPKPNLQRVLAYLYFCIILNSIWSKYWDSEILANLIQELYIFRKAITVAGWVINFYIVRLISIFGNCMIEIFCSVWPSIAQSYSCVCSWAWVCQQQKNPQHNNRCIPLNQQCNLDRHILN